MPDVNSFSRLALVYAAAGPDPWARSQLTAEAAARLVADNYRLDPTKSILVRSFVNDVYRIDTTEGSYALKVYRTGRFTTDEVRWEQDLTRHLAQVGLPVPADVALRDGDSVGTLDAPEGTRPFALATWIPGRKPQPPWTDALYRSVGSALAGLHSGMDSFSSRHPRRTVRRGDEPEQVVVALDGDRYRQQLVAQTAAAARIELDRLSAEGLCWGLTHGDPSLDNLHLDEAGAVSFYDFDLAGPGWQVEDLTGALSTDRADAFLEGYVAERPLPQVELAALPWLRILGHIDNLKFHLIDKPASMGTSTLAEGWVERGFEGLINAARDAGVRAVEDLM